MWIKMYKTTKNASQARVETLENRQMLSASINSVSIVNAASNAVIETLSHGQTIDLSKYSSGISFRANTSSDTKSVKFGLDGDSNHQVESFQPYALMGDKNGDYNAFKPTNGWHSIKVTPYSKSGATGSLGEAQFFAFKVVNAGASTGTPAPSPSSNGSTTSSPQVTSLSLINVRTNAVVGTLSAGQTVDLSKYPDGISIRANTNSAAKSVRFDVNSNTNVQTESGAPFALLGDKNGDYNAWKPPTKAYTIKVTPFSQASAKGTVGSAYSLKINVINGSGSGTNNPAPAPDPIPNNNSSTPQVLSYSLIDPTTNKVIRTINNGDIVNLNDMANGQSINIRANANTATKSVRFGFDSNLNYRLEVGAPYTLSGDSGNDYWSMAPSMGKHYVTTTAYSNANGSGTSTKSSLSFTVVRQASSGSVTTPVNTAISVTPANNGNSAPAVSFLNPFDNAEQAYPGHYVVRLNTSDSDGSVSKAELFVGTKLIDSTTDKPFSFAWNDVAVGTYVLTARVTDNDGAQKTTSITVTIKNATKDDTFYVSTSGSDNNSGSSTGSALRTIAKAASLAGPGDTVVILPGTYRESVTVKNNGTATAPITFKAQTPGTVYIDGADAVTGWSREGSSNIYAANWSKDFFRNGLRYHSDVSDKGYAEQFVVDGKALTQVLKKSDLSAGEFYVDWNANKVFVWLNGNADARDKTVYGSNRQVLFAPSSAATGVYVTIEGLNFRHAANFPQQPAVKTADGWVIRNSNITLTNSVSLGFYGNNVLIDDVTLSNSGHTGLTGQGSNTLLNDLTMHSNNTKQLRWSWESGGGKLTRTDGLYVLNMNTYNNFGPGLWLDVYNTNFVVEGGFFHDNKGYGNNYEGIGLFLELSPGPGRIFGGSFYGNTGAAVSVSESTDITLRGNYFADYVDIRNMVERGMSVKNVFVYGNYFKNAKFISSIGNLDINSFRTLNIKADYNTFNNGSDAWYNWTGKSYSSASAIYNALGVEQNGKSGSVTIPLA